ncbi:hypothetical protein K503DRAFT_769194 [Rhizopogon vinicolor AM-OR11-026]|uniref:Uncharacterized protein n=1 Tax=Rhizopogon vinicolor AM-OR11-026 TaxID=1314800 RepID=A0A1B7N4L6_9AGAM|nr:hypothetical protein K503DRAFT_769194 [Rhizopogon vinicolor AM-OR11-026]
MSSSSSSSSLSRDNLYSNLATFTFGEAPTSDSTYSSSYDSDDEAPDAISPLTPLTRTGADRTPRPSVSNSTTTSSKLTSSHPTQDGARLASNPFPSSSRSAKAISSSTAEHTDEESSEVPSSPDLISRSGYHFPRRGHFIPDNSSQHTFGHLPVRSSIACSSHSRSSSRASSRDLEFSDEEVEIDYYDGGSSPVTFARDLDDIDEDAPTFHRPVLEHRRGSLPMTIPGSSSDVLSNRSRESSILTLRRPSRSLDDDLASHLSSHSGEDPTTVVPRSEPLTRADFRSLEVLATQQQQQQQQQLDRPWDGFDLTYILSRKSEGSIRSLQSAAKLSFIGRSSIGEPSSSRISNTWLGGGRRTSTVTLQTTGSNEDTFLKHVGVNGNRSDQWSFLKEKADGPAASSVSSTRHGRSSSLVPSSIAVEKAKQTMFPGTQEIWRSGHVGRYRVDRLAFKPSTADQAKAAQQRINVRHIPDPYLKGTKTGGPSSVIHKHSRAIAFSIFRSYSLFQSKRGGSSLQPGSRNIHMHTSGGIMLAPKKVQEQYTSTKTTSKLSTHGLLEEGSRKAGGSADKSGSRRGKEKEDAKKAKAKDKKKDKDKDKKKERASYPAETESSTTNSSAGSVNGSSSHIMSAPVRATTSKITFAPSPKTIVKLQPSSGPSSPETTTPDHSAKKPLDADPSSPVSVVNRNLGHRGSIDSDERRIPTRTPHAEAFGTLDPNDIEHLRRAQKPSDGSSSFNLNRIFRKLRGASSRLDSNGSTAAVAPQNTYSPPWIVVSGRDQNEEHSRVLTDLNNSFRDVGLLHTQPHKSGAKGSAKKKTGHDIFDFVPEDSLYMLLPLWAGETDPSMSSSSSTQATTLPTIPENRQYLLVWYVPFEENKGKKPEQQQSSAKKKAKQSHSTSDGTGDTHQKNVYLSNFRVNARLVQYDALRGTGIRVPNDGLAITAPAWEAVSYSVDAARAGATQLNETTICVCSSREKGFQFLQEGLTRLGLCSREEIVPVPPLPPAPDALPQLYAYAYEYEQPDVELLLLTPIGRAAVEMVWLGCLAITSFSPS